MPTRHGFGRNRGFGEAKERGWGFSAGSAADAVDIDLEQYFTNERAGVSTGFISEDSFDAGYRES